MTTLRPLGVPVGTGSVSGREHPLTKSPFSPQYAADFNSDERDVAVYLDAEETIRWWHRSVVRSQYVVQGWRRARIYPDFIFAAQPDGTATRTTVLETEGDHLAGTGDTSYKEAVLDLMGESFRWDPTVPPGTLELFCEVRTVVHCRLVLMSEWRTKIPNLLVRR